MDVPLPPVALGMVHSIPPDTLLAPKQKTRTKEDFFQAEDGIRDVERSRGLGDVYKRQALIHVMV